jgi:hypothetical protein
MKADVFPVLIVLRVVKIPQLDTQTPGNNLKRKGPLPIPRKGILSGPDFYF